MSTLYPIVVDLSAKKCVVVGGGKVAERKIASLLQVRADVHVVSPVYTETVSGWIEESAVKGYAREYEAGDLDGAFLVFAATDSPVVNDIICRDAESCGCSLYSAADDGAAGSFMVPATVRRGKLLIAVSTSGASPTAARFISREIGAAYGDRYAGYVDFLGVLRERIRETVPDEATRKGMLKEIAQYKALADFSCEALQSLSDTIMDTIRYCPSVQAVRQLIGRWLEGHHADD